MPRGKIRRQGDHTSHKEAPARGTMTLVDLMQRCNWHEMGIWPRDMLFAALWTCKSTRTMAVQSLHFMNGWEVSLVINATKIQRDHMDGYRFYALSLPKKCSLTIATHHTRRQKDSLKKLFSKIEEHLDEFKGPTELIVKEILPLSLQRRLRNMKRLESLSFDITGACNALQNFLMHTNAGTLERVQTGVYTVLTLQQNDGLDVARFGMMQRLKTLRLRNIRLHDWRDSIMLSAMFGRVKAMEALETLDLSGNQLNCNEAVNQAQLGHMLSVTITKLGNLRCLNLRDCGLRTASFLCCCQGIEEIDIGENYFRCTTEKHNFLKAFSGMQRLKRLSMDRCGMGAHSMYIISHCMAVKGVAVEFIDFSKNECSPDERNNTFWLSVVLLDVMCKMVGIKVWACVFLLCVTCGGRR